MRDRKLFRFSVLICFSIKLPPYSGRLFQKSCIYPCKAVILCYCNRSSFRLYIFHFKTKSFKKILLSYSGWYSWPYKQSNIWLFISSYDDHISFFAMSSIIANSFMIFIIFSELIPVLFLISSSFIKTIVCAASFLTFFSALRIFDVHFLFFRFPKDCLL